MPDENEVIVHAEVEMNPISKLIWEVSQQPVLYDSQNPLYKDSSARQTAWLNVARVMKIPVTDCQIKWGTLRRCLANARKRQMKRQAGGSKFIKKWRYQDEMAFLLPFIDQREYEFINVSSRRRRASKWLPSFAFETSSIDPLAHSQDLFISEEYEQPIELDDSQPETKPSRENLQMFVVGKPIASSSPISSDAHDCPLRSQQSSSTLISTAVADEMYIEEDEIENVPVDTDATSDSFSSFGQLQHKHLSVAGTHQKQRVAISEIALDEMDSFFLSMSKALKKLPQVEQINVRSQVYDLVTRAEINWLQTRSSSSTTSAKLKADT